MSLKRDKRIIEETALLDKDGNLKLPQSILNKLGLSDSDEVKLMINGGHVEIMPNLHSLSKLYIEPTARCNLSCTTCIRNTWHEDMGEMEIGVFDSLIDQLKEFKSLETIMFGGFGEPTYHKDILYMIKEAKSLGVRVEMTTNGTLLDEEFIKGLFESKIDTLWVSFDGTDEEVFDEVRKGASFISVIDRMQIFKKLSSTYDHEIEIGIAFVAMKSNVNEMGNLHKLIRRVGAKKVSISNVLPYTEDMVDEMLCEKTITDNLPSYYRPSADVYVPKTDYMSFYYRSSADIRIPKFDYNDLTKDALHSLYRFNDDINPIGSRIYNYKKECKFIKERTTFIRWDGKVAPCMGLLHSYTTYSHDYKRNIEAYILGDIKKSRFIDIWKSEKYSKFREDVDEFDFSPCQMCSGCDFLESNKDDCFGNSEPVCGACLWGLGVIQCP